MPLQRPPSQAAWSSIMADAAVITVYINAALETKVRMLSDELGAEKLRFGMMNAACKVALARVAELEAALAEGREYRKHVQSHCEHDWSETLRGPDTVGEHCFICGVDREYDYGDEP